MKNEAVSPAPGTTLPSGELKEIERIIRNALREDIGGSDHTSLACISPGAAGTAKLIAKDAGMLAGAALASMIFRFVDPALAIVSTADDGSALTPGDTLLSVSGNLRSILAAERTVLNFMQRMSGIASKTARMAALLKPGNTKLLDTRKTTPGLRAAEKWAVRIGGGHNHRCGLYDMILIKDNHIDFAGGVRPALMAAREYVSSRRAGLMIEIEARNTEEVRAILKTGGADRILLDNFGLQELADAVRLINGAAETEASGNIDEHNIVSYRDIGLTYVSSGALTHSVKSLDMSLTAVAHDGKF